MNDNEIKELVSLLIKKLKLKYGSLEIKVHDGKWSHFIISRRTNFNDDEQNAD